jgi:hypothetical protein
MDGMTLSIAEMRRFPHMTGQNESFRPKAFHLGYFVLVEDLALLLNMFVLARMVSP